MAAAEHAAPTPPQEEQPTGAYASYVPHDLKYSQDFEDAVMQVVTSQQQQHHPDGIRVIPAGSNETPVDGVSVNANAISLQSLPSITEDELPLPLDDPRRIFASPVPGIKLTHPGGYLEGGPGLSPSMDTFAEDFLSKHSNYKLSSTLQTALDNEMEGHMEELRSRTKARKRAKEHNQKLERELNAMHEEHRMELKVHKKMAEERRAKKEAKEKRKAGG